MNETNTNLSDFGTAVESASTRASSSRSARISRELAGLDMDRDNDDKDLFYKVKKSQWALCGPGEFLAIQKTQKSLSDGVYRIKMVNGEIVFYKTEINVDDLLTFPDSMSDKILKEIDDFWSKSEAFKKFGFLHRRGYLLYGPAGGGKTSLVQQILKKIIDLKGVVFLVDNPMLLGLGLAMFREVEPTRNVVCVFEDLDSIIDTHGEDAILSILDGEMQIDKVLNIATTNYPEKLDKRLVGRPRRFDRVMKIEMPDETVRRLYFTQKLGIEDKEIDLWIKKTEDFSFAAMAELVISVKCLGTPFNDAVKILSDLLDSKPTSEHNGGGMGFGARKR